jgi:hypothetical protein
MQKMKINFFSVRMINLIFIVCFISNSTVAQKITRDSLDFNQLNHYRDKAVKMRNAGMVLTLGGLGTVVTGIILANIPGDNDPDNTGDPAHDGISIWAIAFIDIVGITFTAAGIPLWVVGGCRKAKAELTLKKINIAPENSMALGLGITLKF